MSEAKRIAKRVRMRDEWKFSNYVRRWYNAFAVASLLVRSHLEQKFPISQPLHSQIHGILHIQIGECDTADPLVDEHWAVLVQANVVKEGSNISLRPIRHCHRQICSRWVGRG